jgi:rRNA-processing protein FCF1
VKVILDTNFLLIPITMGVDIFTQLKTIDPKIELFVVDRTIDELKQIMAEQKEFRSAASIGLQLIKHEKVSVIKTEKVKNVDKIILEKAKEGYAVATQDKNLKQQCHKNDIKVIILRQKNYLKIE